MTMTPDDLRARLGLAPVTADDLAGLSVDLARAAERLTVGVRLVNEAIEAGGPLFSGWPDVVAARAALAVLVEKVNHAAHTEARGYIERGADRLVTLRLIATGKESVP